MCFIFKTIGIIVSIFILGFDEFLAFQLVIDFPSFESKNDGQYICNKWTLLQIPIYNTSIKMITIIREPNM